MISPPIKILFFSDSHLGFDLPIRPRIQRRRRGDDFFSNYRHLLAIARQEKVDLLIHGGDFFSRNKIPSAIIDKAYQSLAVVANSGIPIYIVPGNHERSKLPRHLWLSHRNIHIFDRPRTFLQRVGGTTLSLSGFPFTRRIKQHFQALLDQTCYLENKADLRFLCMHQTVEGAQVGPNDFTFRSDPDIIPGSNIPADFSMVLSGHIHRSQRLTHTLDQKPLKAPVIYPGSIERTSFAELSEDKGYLILTINPVPGNHMSEVEFHPLKTRPMVKFEIPTHGKTLADLKNDIRAHLSTIKADSIVRIKFTGRHADQIQQSLSASELRGLAPASMNISTEYRWRKAGTSG